MTQTAKAIAAKVVPWEADAWGVTVHYDDGHRLGYPTASRLAAEEQVRKILNDPIYALRVRRAGPH